MNHSSILSRIFDLSRKECFQARSYAIMTRAKRNAGISFDKTAKTAIPKKKGRNFMYEKNFIVGIKNEGDKKKPNNNNQLDQKKRGQLQSRLENMSFRKPAGITERLVKVSKDIVQPENPHLLKVALLGAANAGKSTLVNKIVGEEVTGVSPKAHTTRERILAVLTEDKYQVVFLDTPGVIPDRNHAKMNRTLATSSWRSLQEADHVIVVVDASRSLQLKARKTEDYLLDSLHGLETPATLVFNKMDLIHEDRDLLKEVKERYMDKYPHIKDVIYISAFYEEGLEDVKNVLFQKSSPKLWIYPAEQKSEMSDLNRAEEIIRIEFFKRLHQYIPYMLKQENAGWTVLKDGTLRIDQNVYVERESQQKIVIGTNGHIINTVVEEACKRITQSLKKPVKLYIQVKTRKAKA